jgi:hypothetical protein
MTIVGLQRRARIQLSPRSMALAAILGYAVVMHAAHSLVKPSFELGPTSAVPSPARGGRYASPPSRVDPLRGTCTPAAVSLPCRQVTAPASAHE